MSNNGKICPLVVADRQSSWWMRRINEFDAVEVWPCKIIEIDGHNNQVMCKPEEATMWVVYGHQYGKERASIEPFNSFLVEGEAERFCKRLQIAYPHLNKDRLLPRSTASGQLIPQQPA